ncbi:MAG TPA: hypothetical protein VMD08_13405 [Candidatus Baltobacteraceae bacterium]|nr:hypothetical protein [Candidatus Baltobacteraceae bacterium]
MAWHQLLRPRWLRLDGRVTLLTFSEGGRIRQLTLTLRFLAVAGLVLAVWLIGSSAAVWQLFHRQIDLARMGYLETENRSLMRLLEGQAEQLSRLQVEIARLKDFEKKLRVASGMDTQAGAEAAPAPPPPARALKRELPKKR